MGFRSFLTCGKFIIVLLLLTFSGIVFSDNVDIIGKVTDGSNVPVKDAVVTLKILHLSDTTDANGDYILNGVTGIVQENPFFCGPMMHVSQGTLSLSGFDQSAPVSVVLYTVNGKAVRNVKIDCKGTSTHSISLLAGKGNGVYLLRIMQGSRSWTLTIASGNSVAWAQKEIVAAPQETTTRSPFQAKRFNDTLVVTHANYQSAFVPVDALQTTINVSLKKKSWTLKKLPDTGQKGDYTKTFGEDSDYDINPPSYTNNSNGTTTDNVTGLMWQTGEGGDMSYPAACVYCDTVHLGGYDDWRLPQNYELFSLVSLDKNKPPFDPTAFSTSTSEYWWSINTAVGDTGRAWVVNAGGGTGAHPKSESINVGGTKHISVKCARNTANVGTSTIDTFTDNNDGTVTDQKTGLMWQQKDTSGLTWEQALTYCENLVLAGHDDWRLPNAKELRSISDESLANPSIDTKYFPTAKAAFYWTSTTLAGNTARAWYIDFKSGLSTYDDKTKNVEYVRAVRGGK